MSSAAMYARKAGAWGLIWGGGDFFAQFWSAHKEAAARRARGEARTGPRPSGAQMLGMVDQPRLAQSVAFGVVAGLCSHRFDTFLPVIFGKLPSNAVATVCALGLQQLLLTPFMTWGYFLSMTTVRGGISDPTFLHSHLPTGAKPRLGPWDVNTYVVEEVMPAALLSSWAAFVPLYALRYLHCRAPMWDAILLPWVVGLSYSQSVGLL